MAAMRYRYIAGQGGRGREGAASPSNNSVGFSPSQSPSPPPAKNVPPRVLNGRLDVLEGKLSALEGEDSVSPPPHALESLSEGEGTGGEPVAVPREPLPEGNEVVPRVLDLSIAPASSQPKP